MTTELLQKRLRDAATTLRTTSIPLSDFMPLLQEAADSLQGTISHEGYMCKVDFDIEHPECGDGVLVFGTLEKLKAKQKCVRQCGITKVRLSFVEIVQNSNY